MEKPRQLSEVPKKIALKIAMVAIFTAIGVVLSGLNPFAWISISGVQPNPFAHLVNVIVGVYLGPIYAVLTATFIAVIRFAVGWGSHYAFPGGIPGALLVGVFAYVIGKFNGKYRIYASLAEPLGTVFIGGTISSYMSISLSITQSEVYSYIPLVSMWTGFAISCVIGMIIGLLILLVLEQTSNITYLNFQ